MKKCVVLFYEGETEEEFYKRLLDEIRREYGKFSAVLEKKCIGGIAKFESKLISKYKHEIKDKYANYEIYVFLCHDTDVFVLSPKPLFDWNNVEKELYSIGAKSVKHIKANYSIENFFLKDLNGLCKYLKIDIPNRLVGNTDYEKICWLLKKGNRLYNKGSKTNQFLSYLDYRKILNSIKDEINELITVLKIIVLRYFFYLLYMQILVTFANLCRTCLNYFYFVLY